MEHLTTWQSVKDVDEYFEKLAEKKLETKRQQCAYGKAFSNVRADCRLCLAQIHLENEALNEFRREKERITKSYERQLDAQWGGKLNDVEKWETEKAKLYRLQGQALRDDLLDQMRGKKEMSEMKKRQEQNDADRLGFLQRERAQELKEAERIAERKKANLKQHLEEISQKQLQKERERMRQKAEDERINRMNCHIGQQQRKNSLPDCVKLRQIRTEIVSRDLAAIHRKQAANAALRKDKMETEVRSFDTTKEKQLEKEKEKRAANLKSISEYRRVQAKENKERKRLEDKRRHQEWMDPLSKSVEMERRDAERRRELNLKCAKENRRIAAERRVRVEQEKKAEQEKRYGFQLNEREDRFRQSGTNERMPKLCSEHSRLAKQREDPVFPAAASMVSKDQRRVATPQDHMERESRCSHIKQTRRDLGDVQPMKKEKRSVPPATPTVYGLGSCVVTKQKYMNMSYRSPLNNELLVVHYTSRT